MTNGIDMITSARCLINFEKKSFTPVGFLGPAKEGGAVNAVSFSIIISLLPAPNLGYPHLKKKGKAGLIRRNV